MSLGGNDLLITNPAGESHGYVIATMESTPVVHSKTAPNVPLPTSTTSPTTAGGVYDVRDSEGDKALANLDEPEWDRIIDTNLKSAYLLIHAALPSLIAAGHGRILNVASIHGTVGDANVVAHCAAKFGLIGMTKALARELREVGVTVNAISPGSTDNKARTAEPAVHVAPLKEKLNAEDVAAAALFLASPSARTISGAVLDVWGGTHLSIRG